MKKSSGTMMLMLTMQIAASSLFADESPAPRITVDNHKTGSTIRYSVVLLRGALPADSKLLIKNANALKHHGKVRVVLDGQRFKALVELAPGKNSLLLETTGDDAQRLNFDINYQPQTNPYYVRLVWMTGRGGDTKFAAPTDDTPQDYEARLRTAGLLMQTFTAERMHQLGYGHRTFRLERDKDGQVIVHTWKGSETRESYYDLGDSGRYWQNVRLWLNREHPDPLAKNVVLAAFTRKDARTGKMKGHTALGGANLGLFGSASVFSWPRSIQSAADVFLDSSKYDVSKVHDDSVGRSTIWGVASTTIGATLHEMGHTFGLPHCRDRYGIMSRGFDYFNRCFTFQDPISGRNRVPVKFAAKQEAWFAPVSASFLRWSRWFQLDKADLSPARPKITVSKDGESIEVSCPSGVPWVGFHIDGNIHAFREFATTPPPKKVTLPMKEIRELLNGKSPHEVRSISGGGEISIRRLRTK